jgi:hypothetical protein
MEKTLITDVSELGSALKKAVKDAIREMNEESANDKLYTINQVRIRLGKSHKTIKNLVTAGLIKTTASGLITESAINQYLQKS